MRDGCSDLELWAKFINAERKEEFDMLAEKNPYIDNAWQQLQIISQDKEKRLEYEARQKAVLDHNQMMLEARQDGLEQGIQQGIRILIIDGLEDQLPKKRILLKLQRYFSLTEEQAEEYFDRFSSQEI